MSVLNSTTEEDDLFLKPESIAEQQSRTFNRLAGTVTGVGPALGLADTVVQSGLNVLGAVAGTPTDIESVIPDLFEPYHRDREFFRGVGDVAGVFVGGIGAPKLFATGGRISKVGEALGLSSKTISRFSLNTARSERWERALKMHDARGVAKAKRFGIARTGTETAEVRKKLTNGLTGARVKYAAKEALIAETAIVATLNDSELLFGEDGVGLDEVLIGSAFAALPVGAAYLQSGRFARISALRAQQEVDRSDQAAQAGFRRGYDVWTDLHTQAISAQAVEDAGAALEVTQASLASSGTKASAQDFATEVANLRGEVTNRIKQNVTALGKGQPFASRQESLAVTSQSTLAKIDNDQARLASDFFVENPDEAVEVSAIRSVKDLHKTIHEQTAAMDEATKASDQAKFDRVAGHNVYVIERDGTSQNGIFRQNDYRDSGSLETLGTERGMELRDGTGFALRDGTVLKPGGVVPDNNVADMTEAYALYEATLTRNSPEPLKKTGGGITHAHLDAQYEALTRGQLQTTDIGKTQPEILLAIVDEKVKVLREMAKSDAVSVAANSPTDVSKILGWKLHDNTGEYTDQAKDLMLYASLTKGKPSQQGSIQEIADNVLKAAGHAITPANRQAAHDNITALLLDAPYKFNTRTRTSRLEGVDTAASATPVVYVQRPDARVQDLDFRIAKDVAQQEAVAFRKQSLTDAGGIISATTELARANRITYEAALNVHELNTKSLRNQRNAFFTREDKAADSPVLAAAARLQTEISRATDRHIKRRISRLEEMANIHTRKGQEAVVIQEDTYAKAFYSGQLMKADFVTAGRQELDLDDAPTRKIIAELFPGKANLKQRADMFDVAYARATKAKTGTAVYRPIELEQEAVDIINEQINMSYEILQQNNALRAISNSNGVNLRRGHVMPRNLANKEVVFFRSGAGRVTHYIAGNTPLEAEKLAARALNTDSTLVRATDLSIQQYKSYVDDAFSGQMKDFTDPLKQTGTVGGKLFDDAIDYSGNGLRERMVAIREGYRNIANRSLQLEFEQALNYAERAHGQSGWDRKYKLQSSDKGSVARYSPWDEYRRLLLGESGIAPDSIVGQVDRLFENGIEAGFTFAAKQLGIIQDGRISKGDERVAEQLWNNGQGINIGGSMEEILERVQGKSLSVDTQRALQRANKAVATATLRFLGFGHALLNVSSLATTMPAITQRMVRAQDESAQEWRDRIGPIADFLDEDIATISSSKLMAEGIEAMFNPNEEMRRAYRAAFKRGYFDAAEMEALQQTIYSRPSDLAEALDPLIGQKSKRNPRGGLLTNVSDKSEVLSRRLAWGMGYSLAKRIGKRDMTTEDMYAFAHYYANQTIANYDPRIRPDSFRGTAGIPLGLFQTFVVNYMQRATEMVASGDRKALRVQMLAQGMTFGLNSLPGYDLFANNFGNTSSLEENVTDRLYRTFGKDTADLLFAGTLANLPKIIPGNDEGLGIYTRGTITPQVPTFLDLQSIPAVSIIKGGMDGVSQFVKEAKSTDQASPQRIAELVASYSPIRATKSMAELFLGQSYNRNGDLLSSDTRDPVSVLARILGTRTLTENKTMMHLWENGQYQRAKRERTRAIGNVYTARLRENGGETTPELRQEFYDKFVKYTSEKGASMSLKSREEKAAVLRVMRDIKKLDTQREDGSYVDGVPLTRLLGVAPAPGFSD